jgi:hypothetical protein
MGPEHRKDPRKTLRISAEVRAAGQTMTGTTRNLSAGGVCVEIDRPLKEGTLLHVVLFIVEEDVELAGGANLELAGTVQWSAEAERGHALGIKFANVSAQHQAAIERALKHAGEM